MPYRDLSNCKVLSYRMCMSENETVHPLRKWRLSAGKSQVECAAIVGVSRQTWIEWEKGRNVPKARSIAAIYRLTSGNVSAAEFYQQIDEAA